MKAIRVYIILFFILLLCAGCEQIGVDDRYVRVELPMEEQAQVLLVEFTGVGCNNCPMAAIEAERLREAYGEHVVVVAMHPASNAFTKAAKKYDYTCEAADVYYKQLGGVATTPFPTGNIDFKQYNEAYFTDYALWGSAVTGRMQRKTVGQVQLDCQYAETTRAFSVRVDVEGLQEQARVALWLVEDSVFGAQRMPDGTTRTDYWHRNMLRGALTDVWGEEVAETKTFAGQLDEAYRAEQCRVVVVVFDEQREVVMVQETGLF